MVSKSRTTDESLFTVDDCDLAMGTVVAAVKVVPAKGVIPLHLSARFYELLEKVLTVRKTSQRVHGKSHLYTMLRTLDQCRHQLFRHISSLKDVRLDVHAVLCL